MDFFEKAFQWLAEVSQKLPAVDTNLFFIVVMAVIFGLGIVIAFTLFGSRARKLYVSARKIRKYLANVDAVDDDNVSDFTAHCFSKNTPQPLRDAWVQYLGVRFGYPSDIVSDGAVYDKFVKKNKDVRSGVFIGVSLVLLALFAFWGYGVLPAAKMGVVHLAALALIGVMYLVLVILARKQNQRCFETFEAMQEDLDAKVNLQIESNFATDSSPLQELNSLVEEIIARNTAKVVDEDDEQTPIEALIEQKMQEQSEFDDEDEQENIDEIMSAQEEAQEENAQDGDVESDDEQRHIDELLQEQEEGLEETADEESEETETAIEEADEQVEQQEHIDELLQEQEEELEEKAKEESDETELEIESADETFVDEPQESEEEQSVEEQELVETADESESVDEPETVDESENEEVADVENEGIEENTQNVEYTESEENNVQEEESVEEDAQEVAVEDESVEQETEEQDSDEEAAEETENVEEDAQTDEIAEESEREESETLQDVESEQNDKIESESEDNDENVEEGVEESVEEGEESADKAVEDNESEDEKSDDNAESDESESEEVEKEAEDVEEESEEIEEAKEDEEPEVVYVVDDEEEEENAKPAKLVKLPNLVDYMLSKNMPRQMKIQIATMLIGTYNKFKDSKEDRKIVISCLGKVMRDLQSEKQ